MDLQRRHRYSRFTSGILAMAVLATPGAAGALTVGTTLPSLPAGPTGPVAAPPTPKLPAPVAPVEPPALPKVVTPPPVKAPVVKAPVVKAPVTVKAPTVKAPSVKTPSVTVPKVPSSGGGSVTGSLPTVRQPIVGGGSSGGLIGGGSSGGGTIVGGLIGGGGGGITGGGGVGGSPGGPLGGGTLGGPGSGSGAGSLGGGPSGAAGAGGYGSPTASGGQFNPLMALLTAESSAGASVGSREFAALQAAVSQLGGCMEALAPLEQQVLVTRFGLGAGPPRSVGGVSRALGISRAGVIRVERRALIALRKLGQSGCGGAAGATGLLTYVLDPTTLGGLVSAAGPGTGGSTFGGPARAAALTPPLWGSDAAGSLRSLLLVLALAGVLLLLAGTALKMQERFAAEAEAAVGPSHAREPRPRPGAPLYAPARRRTAERRFERSNGRITARRPGDRTRTH